MSLFSNILISCKLVFVFLSDFFEFDLVFIFKCESKNNIRIIPTEFAYFQLKVVCVCDMCVRERGEANSHRRNKKGSVGLYGLVIGLYVVHFATQIENIVLGWTSLSVVAIENRGRERRSTGLCGA
jgi:hypothetical protein